MPQVVLTYDLHGAASAVYQRLNDNLRAKQYKKALENTTWEATWNPQVSVDSALSGTKSEFDACAVAAGARSYDLKVWASADPLKTTIAKR